MENTEVMRVVTNNGQLIFDNQGRVCLQNQAGALCYVSSDCLPPHFFDEYTAQPAINSSVASSSPPPTMGVNRVVLPDAETCSMDTFLHSPEVPRSPQEATYRTYWTRPDVLQLIEAYKKHKHLFDNSTIRNEIVWRKISDEINHHTPQEVQNKFKYLKQRYVKKKDSMGPRSTGGKPFQFEYYAEFEEIFSKDPNIQPISLASTSTIMTEEQLGFFDNTLNTASTTTDSMESAAEPLTSPSMPKRRKNSNLVNALQTFEKNAHIREEAKERRHKEAMAAINRFNSLMEEALKKL